MSPTVRDEHVLVRPNEERDFPGIEALSRRVYPDDYPWTAKYLAMHREQFPEGQLVAVDRRTGEVVGFAATLIIRWGDYADDAPYKEITGTFRFDNHDPEGDTLYGAEVMVDPARRREGIGSLLYRARRELLARLGLRRILAGARLPGYARHAATMTAGQYVEAVVRGELSDPTLSFQLSRGFRVVGLVPDYQAKDHQSRGYAALIEQGPES